MRQIWWDFVVHSASMIFSSFIDWLSKTRMHHATYAFIRVVASKPEGYECTYVSEIRYTLRILVNCTYCLGQLILACMYVKDERCLVSPHQLGHSNMLTRYDWTTNKQLLLVNNKILNVFLEYLLFLKFLL